MMYTDDACSSSVTHTHTHTLKKTPPGPTLSVTVPVADVLVVKAVAVPRDPGLATEQLQVQADSQ